MPEIQEINEFKNDLVKLGNEPEIREQRGESLPNITVPEVQSVDDLSALFEDVSDDTDTLDEAGLFGEDDFNLPEGLISNLSEDLEELESEIPEAESELPEDLTEDLGDELESTLPEIDEPAEDLDAVDFGDFDLGEMEESEETPAIDDAETTGEAETIDEAETVGEADTFGEAEQVSDFETADFDLDEFDIEEAETEVEPGPPAFDDVETTDETETVGEADTFGDTEQVSDFETADFDLEGFDIEETEAEVEPEAEAFGETDTVGEAEQVSDFDTGDFDLDGFDMEEAGSDVESEGAASGDDLDLPAEDKEAGAAEFSDLDMFDTSELDEPEIETEGAEDSAIDGDDFSLEDFSLEEIDGDDIETSEFSLGDLGEEFGVDDEEETEIGHLEGLGEETADIGEDFGDAYADDSYAIPDDEYIELKKTLGTLPRNLKLLIEELIGEKNLGGENLDKLIQALIRGAGAKEIGGIVSKITGKKVRIPAQYERRTAEEFEKEKGTFGYVFRKNFVPMFRAAAITAVALGLLLFIGYRFIYTPLHAESLYRKGYEEIPLGNNAQANAYFEQAFDEWQKKNWFYKYAESFIEQKQYILAEEKYEQLLGWYPDERDAVLDYAELEFKTLGKYPEAEALLNNLLFYQLKDYDARIMLADTYMEWAREIDPAKYEDARFNYAKLLEQYGNQDELLFRMLRYFIRTDNQEEAMNLYDAFRHNDKADVESDIYAELAGYLIDNQELEDVREILMKAKSADEELPEAHYHLARYFDIIDIPYEEEKALNAAIWLFEHTSPITRTRNGMLIDSYNRYGMVLYEQDRYIDAEDYFQKAASNYDEALAAGQIKAEPKYGNIFSNLGDLSYYISGDYEQALKYFEKAERSAFSPPILKYKKGYIHYSNEDFRDALVEFYDTADGFSVDRSLMYSTANALFNRNDYYLAEGYYTHLLDLLDKEYSSINYLLIDEIPEHRALLENMMKVRNNLGVTKYRLYERNRDPEKNAEAMVLLTDSVEDYDKLSRNPNSLIEPETVNLSYLNSRAVFYPVQDYRLQIYQDIPKDLDKINF
ncbi:MAG TPA: hypothetical protein DCO79_14250 [Spirochaeta sp.]|nr:hypothetical protein [Spirochaeta sp.]